MEIQRKFSPETSNKALLNSPHLKKEELEALLTSIISKTSIGNIPLRIDLRDCTESSVKRGVIKIEVSAFDTGKTKVTLRVQLPEQIQIWIIDIFLKISMQGGNKGFEFRRALNAAALAFCKEETQKAAAASPQNNPDPDLDADPDPTPDPPGGSLDPPPPMPRKTRAPRRNISEIITDEVVEKILVAWMTRSGGVKIIAQRELGEILSSLGVLNITNQQAAGYLERVGVANVIPVERHPQVEITEAGLALLEKIKAREAKIAEEEAEAKRIQEALKFPKTVLPCLENLRVLQDIQSQLNQLAEKKAPLEHELLGLREQVAKKEAELAKKEAEEEKLQAELGRLISSLGPDELESLIKIAEKA